MKICGLQKTTLLDFPGHVAATIFTGGCNFRCPFCHNSDLLGNDAPPAFTEEEVLSFLSKRSGILEGVAITGGEPTLQPDLESFIRRIRSIGLQVKLDTNGYRPDVLKSLCEQGLVDYVAMDIKTCKERYPLLAGIPSIQMEPIEESVDYLKSCHIPYEFRTTVVKELHRSEDFLSIGRWLQGAEAYYLQSYQESEGVISPVFSACSKEELEGFQSLLLPFIPNTSLRGVE